MIRSSLMLMATLAGLGEPFNDCLVANCGSNLDIDQYAACVRSCKATTGDPGTNQVTPFTTCMDAHNWDDASLDMCAGLRYGATQTVTSLPGGAAPNVDAPAGLSPQDFRPHPATNWYKVGGLIAIGLASVVGAAIFYAKATHAA